jgi:hypothetical protein
MYLGKIDRIVNIFKRLERKGEHVLQKESWNAPELDEGGLRSVLEEYDESGISHLFVSDNAAAIAFVSPLDINPSVTVCRIAHFVSLSPKEGREILKRVEAWAKWAGARYIIETTFYNDDDRQIPYFESKGYTHCGYVFAKEL